MQALRRASGFAGLLGAVARARDCSPPQEPPRRARAAACTSTSGTKKTYVCNVPTGTIAGYEVRQWYAAVPNPTPGSGGSITHMDTDIVDADTGAQVPIQRLMLHHIVFTNLNRQDSTCAGEGYLGFDNRRTSAAPSRRSASTPPARSGRRCRCRRLWLCDPRQRPLGDRGDGDEPPLHCRPRLHPLRGDDRLQSRAQAGDAVLARRPQLPGGPDLQRAEHRAEGQAGEEGRAARRPRPPGSTRRASTGRGGRRRPPGRPPTRPPTTPGPRAGT